MQGFYKIISPFLCLSLFLPFCASLLRIEILRKSPIFCKKMRQNFSSKVMGTESHLRILGTFFGIGERGRKRRREVASQRGELERGMEGGEGIGREQGKTGEPGYFGQFSHQCIGNLIFTVHYLSLNLKFLKSTPNFFLLDFNVLQL